MHPSISSRQVQRQKYSDRMPALALPTAQEVLAVNESKQLYRTNLLRLQLDELHKTISPAFEKLTKVDKLIASIRDAVSHVKDVVIPADCASEYPTLHFRAPSITPFAFTAPTSIELVGSYKDHSLVKPLQNIDLALVMPSACFSEKEFKSHRYFDRRTAICGELAKQLSVAVPTIQFTVDFWHCDCNKAMVVASVPNSQWRINLIPCLRPSAFSESRLTPAHKNLAESTICDPLYNASVLEDMYFASDIFACPKIHHFARAVQLAKVWLYRRKALVTNANGAGLSGFHVRVLLAHICTSQSLPREVSAYQLFKLLISLLAKTEWNKQTLVFGSTAVRATHPGLPYPMMECTQLGIYNPLWRVPLAVMADLSAEATQSLSVLDNSSILDPYELLFSPQIRERDFTIILSPTTRESVFSSRNIADEIENVIKKALGKRLYRGVVCVRYDLDSVTVSGDIDASTATTLIDKGPSAEAPEAADFKAFWGKKAELRRFRDGSILECAVWEKSQTQSVAEQIIAHVVKAKFNQYTSAVSVAPLGACQAINANHIELWSALETLRTKLTSIPSLPIAVVNLRPSHARFTATDVSSGILPPLDCTVEFESSQAWPSTRLAVWHTKCAFVLAIRDGLVKQYCTVETAAEDYSEEPFIDVRMSGGKTALSFRLRVFAPVELQRLNRAIVSASSPPSLSEIAAVGQLWFAPMLRMRIHAMSAQCPAISGAIVAAKEWLDNHLLMEPWLHEWVEVTMAHVVEAAHRVPQSPHVLVLEWLFFIANHAYKTSPLFVTLGGEADTTVLRMKYDEAVDHRRSWWISSDIDPDCLFLRRPIEAEAMRIQSLAKSALVKAEAKQWTKIRFGTDNSRVYDILINVEDQAINRLDDYVKVLSEQFKKYLSVHYSKRHALIGLRFEEASFKPQSNAALKHGAMLTVVDGIAIPDWTAITAKVSALLKGCVKSLTIRK